MIIRIHTHATSEERAQLLTLLNRLTGNQRPMTTVNIDGHEVIAFDGQQFDTSATAQLAEQGAVECIIPVSTSYQLVSKALKETSQFIIGGATGATPVIVGNSSPIIIAGPCAVENREQLLETANAVKAAGAHMLRGGAFKPRTSPYQFQGLGIEGLHLLAEAREATGLPVITEVMEPDTVEIVARHADVLQIGSRNMQNFPLLLAAGRNSFGRPIMLKRGLAATIDEWLLAAEYIMAAGNPHVMLCERGIRSFDRYTRNVLDLTCVPLLHELTHLPIIIDPSHATGRRELVPAMSRAAIAAGADGLILETHTCPDQALCDGRQSITPPQLETIIYEAHVMTEMLHEIAKKPVVIPHTV